MNYRIVFVLAVTVAAMLSVTPGSAAVATCAGKTVTILGTPGDDVLEGTAGPDVIYGGDGRDVITGLAGADTICAGSGNDVVRGNEGNDRIYLGPGKDRAYGGNGADKIWGSGGSDFIRGGRGRDTLRGGGSRDTINGDSGTDTMFGGSGADYLNGGGGIDAANGGSAIDSCYAESVVNCDPTELTTDFTSVTRTSCGYSSWSASPVALSGPIYDASLWCRADDVGDQGYIEYDLGRQYTWFKAVVGLGDFSDSATDTFRFRVYGDGSLLASKDMSYGRSAILKANVSNVLRMRLEVTKISGPANRVSIATFSNALVSANKRTAILPPAEVQPFVRGRIGIDLGSLVRTSCGYGSWFIDPASVNGAIYSDSLQCSVDDVGDKGTIDYIMSRAYKRFEATIGQRDDSISTTDVIRYRVYGDGGLLYSKDVGFGKSVDVGLNIAGVLRLQLEVEKVTGPSNTVSRPVFGEPVVTPP